MSCDDGGAGKVNPLHSYKSGPNVSISDDFGFTETRHTAPVKDPLEAELREFWKKVFFLEYEEGGGSLASAMSQADVATAALRRVSDPELIRVGTITE